jgi:hypothetical protein
VVVSSTSVYQNSRDATESNAVRPCATNSSELSISVISSAPIRQKDSDATESDETSYDQAHGLSPERSTLCGSVIGSGASKKHGYRWERCNYVSLTATTTRTLTAVSHSRSPSSRWYHRLWYIEKTAVPLGAMQLGVVECMVSHWNS